MLNWRSAVMVRIRCCGIVDDFPRCKRFLAEAENAETILLQVEEYEAIRLKDYEGLEQNEAAKIMDLSRATFQRVLQSAKQKVAEALVKGCNILIEGGFFKMANRKFECQDCKHVWEVAPCSEGGKHGYEIECPKCGSLKKIKLMNGERHVCGGGHHGQNGHGCCGGHH